MPGLGIVTGLAREAACLRSAIAPATAAIRCAGIGAEASARAARALVAEGCNALASVGIAAGLDPSLRPGTVVLAEAVVAPDGSILDTDGAWRQRLAVRLAGEDVVVARLAGIDGMLAAPAVKRALGLERRALAADMESHAVGRVAADARLPFLAVRVVADPCDRAVPPWLVRCVGVDGRIRVVAALGGALMRPWALASLAALARDGRLALAGLGRVAACAGPGLGFR